MKPPALTSEEARLLLDNLAHGDASKLPAPMWQRFRRARTKLLMIEFAGTKGLTEPAASEKEASR